MILHGLAANPMFLTAMCIIYQEGKRLPQDKYDLYDRITDTARGPESLLYPWGDHWEDGICNSTEAKLERTSPVGIFPRSRSKAFGLDDMAGNVWEWTQDRVLRGGAWNNSAWVCRAAVRFRYDLPEDRNNDVGFRVCLCRQNSQVTA